VPQATSGTIRCRAAVPAFDISTFRHFDISTFRHFDKLKPSINAFECLRHHQVPCSGASGNTGNTGNTGNSEKTDNTSKTGTTDFADFRGFKKLIKKGDNRVITPLPP
jgi:hypothetical protein